MSTAANYPMPSPAPGNSDLEHLRLLSIFHYVFAGMVGLMACFPLIYVFAGIMVVNSAGQMNEIEREMDRIEPKQDAAPGDDAGVRPPWRGRNRLVGDDAKFLGAMIAAIGGTCTLIGWTFAVMVILAGRKLAARRGRTFCTVIAAFSCIAVPIGTVLGVFTIIVLNRPSVQTLFDAPERMRDW